MRLQNKVALITGSTRGIGRTIAEKFAAEGAKVVVTGRTIERGEKNVKIIREAGGEAIFVPLDTADESSAQNAVNETVKAFGKLNILVNNSAPTAAVARNFKPLIELPTSEWEEILHGVITSVFYMSKYAIPHMLKAGGGSIINISSGASITGIPGLAPYAAGKGGMNALTRVIAVEYGDKAVRCNTIIVGRVVSYASDEGPKTSKELLRVGKPSDIAHAATWLASDEAEWVTGSEITADGGVRYNSITP